MNTNIKQRNSSIELLRIFCILGIVSMHFSAIYLNTSNLITLVQLNLINSLFNTCVTCFILISGFFGITRNVDKLLSLWLIVIFYSLIDIAVSLLLGNPISLVTLFKGAFPTITAKYWYFTTYFLLVMFSSYINTIPEYLTKRQFGILISMLILVFYIVPTFFYFEIIKDNGKGPVNMFIVYLIGRYIAIYRSDNHINRKKFALSFCIIILITFMLNLILSIMRGQYFGPFARDNSLFMLMGAIALFALFRSFCFSSRAINFLAKNVFSVYITNIIFRTIFYTIFPFSTLDGNLFIMPAILGSSVIVLLFCNVVELLRKAIFHQLEFFLCQCIKKCLNFLQTKLLSFLSL